MKRRKFLTTTSILSAATLLPLTNCTMKNNPKFKLGYQLFSVHEDMVKDTLGTLQALKAMGYEDFETYGFDDKEVTYYGIKAADFKKLLDELDLTATSGHYGFSDYLHQPADDLKRFVDQCIKGAKALNKPYITWPWLAPDLRTMDNYKLLAKKLNVIGEQVNSAGLGFAYHNHGFEFENHNGEIGYDIIMKETDPDLVKLQIDMYWVMHSSKLTPAQWIDKQPGRFVMWHIKDMDKVTRDYTELGNGSIDYTKILPDPITSGLEYYYIEQGGNFTHSAMQSAATSADYLKKHLQDRL